MDWLDLILKVKLFSLKVKWQATNWIIMLATYTFHKRLIFRDFPGLVVKTTLPLQGAWFDPWLGLPWWLSWWRIHLQCRRPWFDSWVGKIPWRRDRLPTPVFWASLVAQTVKNLPAMRKPGFSAWIGKIPMEEGMATHSTILAWRIPINLACCSPWGHKELDTIEQLST